MIATPSHANNNNPVVELTVSLEGRHIRVIKREAWMLYLLMERGERGVTTLEVPGARLSQYVMKLRRNQIVIETVTEKHSGPFAGSHGRYVLRSPLTIVKVVRAMDKGAAHAA
jgi:hypothetical protein